MKIGAAINEANRIAYAKAKRVARKPKVPRINTANANVPALSTHLPRANQPDGTSSNSMQQQTHNIKFCDNCFRPHDDGQPNH
ncbi:unnamed protein product [Schistocephalus solidus]|uniref:Reverse transcriptase domain-containing protein n=1 Tax=Schistocephalus solidus TaxID=70667 RepID=A0A183T514_SCHSO|nr:unnamed protein product [Schistocephalus solidus]